MSNYVKTTDFAAKDALPTGNPNKIAQGTQVDVEFNNIAAAITTKQDLAARAQADGYASLDGSGDVPDAQIPPTIPRLNQANTFTNSVTIEHTAPSITLSETGVTANNGKWGLTVDGEALSGIVLNDALNSYDTWLIIQRTANQIDSITLQGTNVIVNGTNVTNASLFTTGSLLAGVVPQAAVTQHQAALTIAESQITNGSTLARVGDAETVSGLWNFSSGLLAYGSSVWCQANDGPGSGLNADLLDDYDTSTGATGNTIAARNSGGHIFANYFNTAAAAENTNPAFLFGSYGGDGYIRGITLNGAGAVLPIRNVDGKVGTSKTLASSGPSGGTDGDIWYQY